MVAWIFFFALKTEIGENIVATIMKTRRMRRIFEPVEAQVSDSLFSQLIRRIGQCFHATEDSMVKNNLTIYVAIDISISDEETRRIVEEGWCEAGGH